ncbi:MAG: 2-hydroxyacyl-CoA dehydratase [Chloroflexi bacterium]|nr:2-hydroxyacyl-CoA dehydratase [Chloroflexota bacterium]
MTKESGIDSHGLKLAERHYQDYTCSALESKAQGKKVIGYLCALVPLELIAAAGLVPIRIKSDPRQPITRADTLMETIICPQIRGCFDMAVKGKYDFLDGLVLPHACDSICRPYDVWKYTLNLPYSHFVNMPHGTDDSSQKFYREILGTFRKSLSGFVGNDISDSSLSEAVRLYNENRAAVRELFALRRSQPPLISGMEISKLLIALMGLPVAQSSRLVREVISEVKQRKVNSPRLPRVMIIGAQMDDATFVDLVEKSGAHVVTDALCPGLREYSADVPVTLDPLDGIAERYLRGVKCARTYEEKNGSYSDYLDQRFGFIRRAIEEFKVEGVILHVFRYCDPFGFEVPAMRSYIEASGVPVLYLENEYSMLDASQLETRVQAFIEMIR